MRVFGPALAAALAATFALGTAAQASTIFWVDGNTDSAFEDPPVLGQIPAGWTLAGTNSPLTDNQQVFEGNQSAMISASGGMFRPASFEQQGEYHWMFYDDLSGLTEETASKSIRVGLHRPDETTSSRFGAIAVETGVSRTHYTAHHAFAFTVTSVERSEGWRHMNLAWDVVDGNTVVDYFIDGQLGHTFTHTGIVVPAGEWMGAPFGTASPAWVDMIPEPSSLALLALGAVAAVGVRRRRS